MIETLGSIITLLLFIIMLLEIGAVVLLLALIAGVGIVKPKKRKRKRKEEEQDEILFIPKEGGLGSVRVPNHRMGEFMSEMVNKAKENGIEKESKEEKKPETPAGYL